MGFNLDISIPVLTVFIQGLISFFSPCVLPLLPLYISYFSGNTNKLDSNGNIIYPKVKIFLNTVFFVIGISITFFILGFGFTTFGKFFNSNQALFSKISGIIIILFGLYQLGLFGKGKFMETEKRFNLDLTKLGSSPFGAFILGFTFSFAWTPCIGPIMSSVLLLAGSSATAGKGFFLIATYVAGFCIPFLLTGLFTASILSFFKKHKNIVKYTIKIGAILMIFMGIMTFTGTLNGFTSYLSKLSANNIPYNRTTTSKEEINNSSEKNEKNSETRESEKVKSIDFTLKDQFGNSHTLSDYKGKTVFLNFWATWCPPCRAELPDIQKIYEEYGYNKEDVVILGIAAPKYGNEQDIDGIKNFLNDFSLSYPILMDEGAINFNQYRIRSYPTTFMIDKNGDVFGYVVGSLSKDNIKNIIEQTKNSIN